MLTVTSAATNHNLISLADLKLELGIEHRQNDVELSKMITRASNILKMELNRTLATETVREDFWWTREQDVIELERWPVQSITSFVIDTTTHVLNTDYLADLENGSLQAIDASGRFIKFRLGRGTIVYTAGYKLPGELGVNLPEAIQHAALLVAKQLWDGKDRNDLLKSELVDGVGRRDWLQQALSPQVLREINYFKRVVV